MFISCVEKKWDIDLTTMSALFYDYIFLNLGEPYDMSCT